MQNRGFKKHFERVVESNQHRCDAATLEWTIEFLDTEQERIASFLQ